MTFYIQRTKWQPGKVTVTHIGPFEAREDAVEKVKKIRYNKSVDISIIEKSNEAR